MMLLQKKVCDSNIIIKAINIKLKKNIMCWFDQNPNKRLVLEMSHDKTPQVVKL